MDSFANGFKSIIGGMVFIVSLPFLVLILERIRREHDAARLLKRV